MLIQRWRVRVECKRARIDRPCFLTRRGGFGGISGSKLMADIGERGAVQSRWCRQIRKGRFRQEQQGHQWEKLRPAEGSRPDFTPLPFRKGLAESRRAGHSPRLRRGWASRKGSYRVWKS